MSFQEILGAVVGGSVIAVIVMVVISKLAYGDMSLFGKLGRYIKSLRSG